jgi:hypothetical protein
MTQLLRLTVCWCWDFKGNSTTFPFVFIAVSIAVVILSLNTLADISIFTLHMTQFSEKWIINRETPKNWKLRK